MERPIDYDFQEFRQKKKAETGEPGRKKKGGLANIFLVQFILSLVTAIILLFANVLFHDFVDEMKQFYLTQIRGEAGITENISEVFYNIGSFLTTPAGGEISSSSSQNSSSEGSSQDSSSSEANPSEVENFSTQTMAMGMGGEENPLPLAQESAGLAELDTEPLKTSYVIPLHGIISSSYGYRLHPTTGLPDFHKGIDIPAQEGTPIAAFKDGTIIQAQNSTSFGNFVAIQHENGVISRYGHCSKLNVKVGDFVKAGDIVGFVGNTGYSTGNHCHFDLSVNGVFVNPLEIIPTHQEDGYAAV